LQERIGHLLKPGMPVVMKGKGFATLSRRSRLGCASFFERMADSCGLAVHDPAYGFVGEAVGVQYAGKLKTRRSEYLGAVMTAEERGRNAVTLANFKHALFGRSFLFHGVISEENALDSSQTERLIALLPVRSTFGR
jgi:hypothetical protein